MSVSCPESVNPTNFTSKRPLCFFQDYFVETQVVKSLDPSFTYADSSNTQTMDESLIKPQINENDEFLKRSVALLFENAKLTEELDKERLRKILRQVPIDLLALEWLNSEPRTIENRAYLIGNLLPQIILGLEYILKEAVNRNLIKNDEILDETNYKAGLDSNFNPINRLAEFLMRNNHKYNNFIEISPYVRGLRNTVAKLENEMFMLSENRLAKLKLDVIKRRDAQKKYEQECLEETERRYSLITKVYRNFLAKDKSSVDAKVIQNAVRTFSELVIKLPLVIRSCLIPVFETKVVEEVGPTYDENQFVQYIMMYASSMSREVFEQFLNHLELCASEYRQAVERDERRMLLTKYFISCDVDLVDSLSKDRLTNLCQSYFESATHEVRELIRSPKEWPIREYHLRLQSELRSKQTDNVSNFNEIMKEENNSAADCLIDNQNNSMNENNFTEFKSNQIENYTKQDEYQSIIDYPSIRQLQFGYSSNRLTLSQFILLINQFMPIDKASTNLLKQFLDYMKQNYYENKEEIKERQKQLKYALVAKQKNELFMKIFQMLDTNCSGMIELNKLEKIILEFDDGFYRAHFELAKRELVNQITAKKSQSNNQTSFDLNYPLINNEFPVQKLNKMDFKSILNENNIIELNMKDFKFLITSLFWPEIETYLQKFDLLDLEGLHKLYKFILEKNQLILDKNLYHESRLRSLNEFRTICQNSFGSIKSIYQAIFKMILKDNIQSKSPKQIQVKLSLLRPTYSHLTLNGTVKYPSSHLQYVAAIPELLAQKIVGQCVTKHNSKELFETLGTSSIIYKTIGNNSEYEYFTFNNPKQIPISLYIPIPLPNQYLIGIMELHSLINDNNLNLGENSSLKQVNSFTDDEIKFYKIYVYIRVHE